jgi:hypothetical protein
MNDSIWKALLIGIPGVAIMAFVANTALNWALRSDPGGEFSGILSSIVAIGLVSLLLLGGGLLVAADRLFGLWSGSGF